MQNPLNIPMSYSTPTRRHSRRVVRLLITFFAGLFFLLGTWRLWVTRDTTTTFGPSDAVVSVRLFKTVEVAVRLSEKTAGKQMIPGLPFGPSDFLSSCQRSCTVWISPNGTVEGMTFDTPLAPQTIATAIQYGAFATNQKTKGFIGLTAPESLPSHQHLSSYWHRLSPWNEGEVIETATGTSLPLSLNEHGISLNLANAEPFVPDIYTFSTEVTTTSDAIFSPGDEEKDALLSAFALGGDMDAFSSSLTNGIRIMTGEDGQGAAVALFFQEDSLTDAELETIAASMLSKENLATQELTFKDGTAAAELRSDLKKLEKTTSDPNHTQWQDEKGNLVFFIKDQQNKLLILTNRELVLTERAISHVSACFPGATSFTRTDLLRERGTIADWFEQIAWNKREIKACW